MSATSLPRRYPNSAILLHWLVLLLVAAAYACILLRENYERGTPRPAVRPPSTGITAPVI